MMELEGGILGAILALVAALVAAWLSSGKRAAPEGATAPTSARKEPEAPTVRPPANRPVAGAVAPARPFRAPVSDEERDLMARTLFGECRGEPREGQIAVAWVIRNRAERPRWWGRTVGGVCLAKAQFTCWWDAQGATLRSPALAHDRRLAALRRIVDDVLDGREPDPTGGADHYCTTAIAPQVRWARGRQPVAVIGAHTFYRLET